MSTFSSKLTLASDPFAMNRSDTVLSSSGVSKTSAKAVEYIAPTVSFINSTTNQSVTDIVSSVANFKAEMVTNKSMGYALLAAETAARVAADALTSASLASEVTSRQTQGTQLANDLAVEASVRDTLVSAESALRLAAATTMQAAIDAEHVICYDADVVLQSKITNFNVIGTTTIADENSESKASDEVIVADLANKKMLIEANIAGETSALVSNKTFLLAAVASETTAREAAIVEQAARVTALNAALGIDESKLQDTIAAYAAADVTIIAQIANLNSVLTTYNTNLTTLKLKVDTALFTAGAITLPIEFPAGIYTYDRPEDGLPDDINTIVINGYTVSASCTTQSWGFTVGNGSGAFVKLFGNITGVWDSVTHSITFSNGKVWVYQPPAPVEGGGAPVEGGAP
jgi:hypothetical protein